MADILTFITENWLTILVCILLAAAVLFALKNIKKSKGTCNGDCANCQKICGDVYNSKPPEQKP